MAKGWISLHRQIWESWIWKDKPFSKGQAWIDLLLLVNHKDDKTLIDNKLITVLRGSHITSQLKLMDRWGWGKERVRNFLKLLEADGMILVETTMRYTLITITNYDTYQNQTDSKLDISTVTDEPQTEVRPKSDQSQTEVRPVADRTPSTNNNVNNVNNENKGIPYREIFDYYLSLDIIKHQKLTTAMKDAIKSAMNNNGYTLEDCKVLLDRHKKAIENTKNSQYPVRARPLHEFFGQKAYQAKHLICAEYEEGGKHYNTAPKKQEEPEQPYFNKLPEKYDYGD